jgi:tyrosyl-DNA phosphodiesterase-1
MGQSWKAVTKHLFHDANSRRGGVLMHSKVSFCDRYTAKADSQVLVAIYEKQNNPLGIESSKKRKADDGVEGIGGWAYMGSHNFTPSAWVSCSFPYDGTS